MNLKTKYLLLLTFMMFLFASCTDQIDGADPDPLELQGNNLGTIYPFAILKGEEQPLSRAAASSKKETLWPQNYTIDIAFTDMSTDSKTARVAVEKYAKVWMDNSNITFNFDPSKFKVKDKADARININIIGIPSSMGEKINWSYLGYNQTTQQEQNTMNLVVNAGEENTEAFKTSVRIEFGHLLGLIYEYQRAQADLNKIGISVNSMALIMNIMSMGGNSTILEQLMQQTNFEVDLITKDKNGKDIDWSFDKESIMLPFLGEDFNYITYADGSPVITAANTELSAQDKAYIAAIYPKKSKPEYQRGETGEIFVSVTAEDRGWKDYAILPWNFDDPKPSGNGRIEGTYRTIVIGEYEWTTQNLKMKYNPQKDHYWVDWTVGDIPSYFNGFSAGANVEAFQDLYGTWASFKDGATAFAEDALFDGLSPHRAVKFERKDSKNSTYVNFLLPNRAEIYQMIGQMPKKEGRTNKENFNHFAIGVPEWDIAGIDKSKLNEKNFENISGLTAVLLGQRDGDKDKTGFIGFGQNFSWFTMERDWPTREPFNNNRLIGTLFGGGLSYGMHFNGEAYKFSSVRYCREMSAKELGYDLYENKDKDIVEIVKYGEIPSNNIYQVIPKGLLRGVVLSYIYKGNPEDVSTWEVLKSLSELKAEATALDADVPFYNR